MNSNSVAPFLQFRLKTIFIIVAASAIVCLWLSNELKERHKRALRGLWDIESFAVEGQPWNMSRIGPIHFDGDKAEVQSQLGPEVLTYRVSIDTSTSPKSLELVSIDSENWLEKQNTVTGSAGVDKAMGIYKLNDDTLTICLGSRMPDAFAAPAGSDRAIIVLKRLAQ
jgi:uncharacterized protein (TIGR03067 family)